jgi:hypothetical protein
METWVQFALLMLAIMALGIRNEHRMTVMEQRLDMEKAMRELLDRRVTNIERRRT